MKRIILLAALLVAPAAGAKGKDTWSVKADYIEACSCHLFCPCYFNTSPEGAHHCEFNMSIKIAEGHYGDTNLAGAKMWLSGDLGGDFSQGETKSVVITFDPSVSAKQQEGLKYVLGKLYPVHWKAVAVDTAPVTFEITGMDAHARLGTGQGEISLKGVKDSTGKQSVLQNVAYFGAQKNTGFRLAKSEHHYKGHGHDYSYKDKNGFLIHIESEGKIESK